MAFSTIKFLFKVILLFFMTDFKTLINDYSDHVRMFYFWIFWTEHNFCKSNKIIDMTFHICLGSLNLF